MRRRILALVAIVLVACLVLGLLIFGLVKLFPKLTKPTPQAPSSQPADCPDVQVISIPGTWESNGWDDPYNPTFNPAALLLNVTHPLQQRFRQNRADIFTVPYIAQFSNPMAIPPDGQVSYQYSREEGLARTVGKMKEVAAHCPLTQHILVGFSQGAVIAGDVAADIGAGRGPIAAPQFRGAVLIADGRRNGLQSIPIGPNPPGVGAELAIGVLGRLTAITGVNLRGERKGGFGKVADRVFSICTPGDLICDAPTPRDPVGAIQELIGSMPNYAHALYAGYVVDPQSGLTAPGWATEHISRLIDEAPTPKHS